LMKKISGEKSNEHHMCINLNRGVWYGRTN
jgi:hypothetical protein